MKKKRVTFIKRAFPNLCSFHFLPQKERLLLLSIKKCLPTYSYISHIVNQGNRLGAIFEVSRVTSEIRQQVEPED